MLLKDGFIKNNNEVIILIMWLVLKFLLKSKDVLYQASSDLSEINSFYGSFPDESQKKTPWLSKFRKTLHSTGLRMVKKGKFYLFVKQF